MTLYAYIGRKYNKVQQQLYTYYRLDTNYRLDTYYRYIIDTTCDTCTYYTR